MNSHRRCGLSWHLSILTGVFGARRARVQCCARSTAAAGAGAAHSGGHLPGRHHRRGRRAVGARRARRYLGPGARHRFSGSDQAPLGGDLDRLRCVGSVVRRSAPRRTASVHRVGRSAAPRPVDSGRPALPHPRRVPGRLLRVGRKARRHRWARSPSSTRCTASSSSTTATCMGFVDGTENPDGPVAASATQIGAEDPDFAGGAMSTSSATCTTCRRGTRSPPRSRSA